MFDISTFIKGAGYIGILGIVFAETGLLIGMFLPGDSLLFTAGFLASQGFLSLPLLCMITGLGALLGDNTGYWLGRRFGESVFSRKGSLLFDPSHLQRTQSFFNQYGSKTLVLARFVPIIRTITPTFAGVGRMAYPKFLAFSIIGAVLWGIGLPCVGYYLGSSIPGIDRYLIPIIAGIVLVSVAPGAYHILRDAENRKALLSAIRQFVRRS